MLLEIQSDAFKFDKDHVRPKINFSEGLNVVLGETNAENSIGKSLFLIVIDYCFGGTDYHDNEKIYNNVMPQIGDHVINFAFKFGDEISYFSRQYEKGSVVNVCDSNYKVIKTITLNEFRDFLARKYQIKELSFRNAVSKFIRIYPRGDIDTNKPFKSFSADKDENQITDLVKLFEKYGPISAAHDLKDNLKNKKDAIFKARKFNLIRLISDKQYQENQKTIEDLNKKLSDMTAAAEKGPDGLDELTLQRISALRDQLHDFRQQKYSTQRKIKNIDAIINKPQEQFEKKFEKLTEYFPGIDTQKLANVESFHSALTSILSDELKSNKTKLEGDLGLINEQISRIQKEIEDLNPSNQKVDLDHFEDYSNLKARIGQLESENKAYEEYEKIKTDLKGAVQNLGDLQNNIDSEIEADINEEIRTLTSTYFPSGDTIPNLRIETPEKYSFSTPQDIGAGTTYKGIFLLDFAVRNLTKLPVLVHDSNLFKNLSDKRTESVFKIYQASTKQSFVAFDKLESYSVETQNIVKSHTVLTLSLSQRLYGKDFLDKKEG